MVITTMETTSIQLLLGGQCRTFTVTIPFPRNITIATTLTTNPVYIHNWVNTLMVRRQTDYQNNTLVLGLAIQSGQFGPTTMALCSGDGTHNHCLIVRLLYSPQAAARLLPILENPRITFLSLADLAGVWLPLGIWLPRYMPLNLRRCLDDIDGMSVATIATLVASVRVEEEDLPCGVSDWDALVLESGQVTHATLEAFVPFMVGFRFGGWCFNSYLNPPPPHSPTN